MAPLMVATLLIVVASQIPKLGHDLTAVAGSSRSNSASSSSWSMLGAVVPESFG